MIENLKSLHAVATALEQGQLPDASRFIRKCKLDTPEVVFIEALLALQ